MKKDRKIKIAQVILISSNTWIDYHLDASFEVNGIHENLRFDTVRYVHDACCAICMHKMFNLVIKSKNLCRSMRTHISNRINEVLKYTVHFYLFKWIAVISPTTTAKRFEKRLLMDYNE